MKIINHRINTIEQLKKIPISNGIEIDVRDYNGSLILSHEPFCDGEKFDEFLNYYHHSTLILNTKCEGIEFKILELLEKHGIVDFFFLDCSFAIINKFITNGEKRFAARFSEIESLQTVINLKNKAQWVWIDSFSTSPLNKNSYSILKDAGFKICIVSPDLVGRVGEIENYKNFLNQRQIYPDAVCVKCEYERYWF